MKRTSKTKSRRNFQMIRKSLSKLQLKQRIVPSAQSIWNGKMYEKNYFYCIHFMYTKEKGLHDEDNEFILYYYYWKCELVWMCMELYKLIYIYILTHHHQPYRREGVVFPKEIFLPPFWIEFLHFVVVHLAYSLVIYI